MEKIIISKIKKYLNFFFIIHFVNVETDPRLMGTLKESNWNPTNMIENLKPK
jgi:hypothetical protein